MTLAIGISAIAHDAAVSLIEDGRVVFALEEERLSRVKNAEVFPKFALARLLAEKKLRFSDVDSIGFYWDPSPSAGSMLRLAGAGGSRHLSATASLIGSLQLANLYMWRAFVEFLRAFAAERLEALPPIKYLPHHECHARFAYSTAPFDRCAVLIADGMGELACTTSFEASPGKLKKLSSIDMPHSLGFVYAGITQFLGFQPASDEWKVMGLAAYGGRDPRLERFFEQLIVLQPNGRYEIDRRFTEWHKHPRMFRRLLSAAVRETLGEPRTPDGALTDRHRAIAFALQARIEAALFHVLRELHRRTGAKDLCFGGGVALNCVANARITEETPFERVHVPYAPGDSGAAAGAGLLASGARIEPGLNRSPYLGPSSSDEDIERDLLRCGLTPERPHDIHQTVAQLIADGQIAGWFQGAMELGPRALGHRSILADPRRVEMKDRVNETVKYRETFRPFAPAVLEERAADYFALSSASPYMSFAVPVRDPRLPAVTHVDGTGRVQTVSRAMSPSFHRLIETFGETTGVHVLLNTSFNVRGEPIVCSANDAIRCFFGTGLQHLAIGPFLLSKKRPS